MTELLERLSMRQFGECHELPLAAVKREIATGRLVVSKVGDRTVIASKDAWAWRAARPSFFASKRGN